MHAYGPTQAALISLAESLYFDLTPKGVKLQIICPGFVESEATAINDFEMPDLISASNAADKIIEGMQGTDFSINFPKSFTRKMGLLRFCPTGCFFELSANKPAHFNHLIITRTFHGQEYSSHQRLRKGFYRPHP